MMQQYLQTNLGFPFNGFHKKLIIPFTQSLADSHARPVPGRCSGLGSPEQRTCLSFAK